MTIFQSAISEGGGFPAYPDNADALRALQESNQALSGFAHALSHDLKGPLRHIATYSQMLNDIYGAQLGEQGQKFTARIVVNSNRAVRLLEDLLAYAEAKETPEEKTPVNLNKTLVEIIDTLQDTVYETGAVVSSSDLPIITAFPTRLRQLLQNLILNALTYKSRSAPVISITATELESEYLFSVQDNGPGIDPQYQAQVFEPFQRLHSRDDIEGSGLGLAICRRIIDLHGGKLWVESEGGSGATFFFTLPKQ